MKRFLPWKVLHLSISDHVPDLSAEDGIGGLFVVFWCDAVPLGQAMIPAPMLPIASAQLAATAASIVAPVIGDRLLRNGFEAPLPVPPRKQPRHPPVDLKRLLDLDRPLESLSRPASLAAAAPADPSVSLVICTRNRPGHLAKCLRSLRGLSPQPSEIIVVDNDPSSGVTRPVTDDFHEVTYVAEPRRGLSAARNAGILRCRGAIIAFTDDDVIVHPGWIGAIRAAFCDSDVIAVTGLVLPAELATPAQFVFQDGAAGAGWEYRQVDFGRSFFDSMKSLGVPAWRLGAGANMAFRCEAFERVGLFDERLGAGSSGCSEDSELWYRLLAEGQRCRYAPTAVVFHYHREDWAGLRDQLYSYTRGHVAALLFQFDRYGHWGNVYRAFVVLPWHLVRLAYRSGTSWLGARLSDNGGELRQPLVPQLLGAVAGYGYYVRHRRRPPTPLSRGTTCTHAHAWNIDNEDNPQKSPVHVPEP